MKYSNFIILVNDIKRIDFNDFVFRKNKILVIEDNDANREKLKYLHSIRWNELMAEYYFCEYSNNKNTYINTFCFIDTEKIIGFKYFMKENSTNIVHIICTAELEKELRKALPNANYCVLKVEKYIDKERKCYCYLYIFYIKLAEKY